MKRERDIGTKATLSHVKTALTCKVQKTKRKLRPHTSALRTYFFRLVPAARMGRLLDPVLGISTEEIDTRYSFVSYLLLHNDPRQTRFKIWQNIRHVQDTLRELTDTDNASVKYQGFYLEHIFRKKLDSTHPYFLNSCPSSKICE